MPENILALHECELPSQNDDRDGLLQRLPRGETVRVSHVRLLGIERDQVWYVGLTCRPERQNEAPAAGGERKCTVGIWLLVDEAAKVSQRFDRKFRDCMVAFWNGEFVAPASTTMPFLGLVDLEMVPESQA